MESIENLSEKEVKECHDVFVALCRVTVADLITVSQRLGIPNNEQEIGVLLGNTNINGHTRLDYNALLLLMARCRSSASELNKADEEEMLRAFKTFDKDGNGFIDEKELYATMQSLGEKLSKRDVKAMIKSADKNGDGHIDYHEFIRMMFGK